MNNRNLLTSYIKSKKIILIGENHGVLENVDFVKQIVETTNKLGPINFVGFEYPIFAFNDFKKAASQNRFGDIKDHKEAIMLMKDGRFSKKHFDLLVFLSRKNIPFIFFDSDKGNWDDRDEAMFKNIQKERESQKERKERIILIAGNIHTNLNKMTLNNRPYKPLGAYFEKREVILIKLEYHSGEFFNFGRKKFTETKMSGEPLEIVSKNQINYHIPIATPTQ